MAIIQCIYYGIHSSFWFDTINIRSIVYDLNFQIEIVFFSLKIVFVLANSVDPDEMLDYAAFHLGLHCLSKYAFRSH